jgi:hypothetical protein
MILTALAMTDKEYESYRFDLEKKLRFLCPKLVLGFFVWITLYIYEYSETIYEL